MSDIIAKMTASVLIIENEKCLVLEEDDDGVRKFNLPGGHMEFGETPIAAAVREAKEETGYDVEVENLLTVQVLTWKQHNTCKYIFYGRRIGGEESLEPGTIAHWMDKAEIEAVPKDRWIRNMDEVLLLGLEGYKIDSRAVMLYDEGKKIRRSV